jgi:hypothetical protein
MTNAGILVAVITLLTIASPVAATPIGGEVKPLKILALGKHRQDP